VPTLEQLGARHGQGFLGERSREETKNLQLRDEQLSLDRVLDAHEREHLCLSPGPEGVPRLQPPTGLAPNQH